MWLSCIAPCLHRVALERSLVPVATLPLILANEHHSRSRGMGVSRPERRGKAQHRRSRGAGFRLRQGQGDGASPRREGG